MDSTRPRWWTISGDVKGIGQLQLRNRKRSQMSLLITRTLIEVLFERFRVRIAAENRLYQTVIAQETYLKNGLFLFIFDSSVFGDLKVIVKRLFFPKPFPAKKTIVCSLSTLRKIMGDCASLFLERVNPLSLSEDGFVTDVHARLWVLFMTHFAREWGCFDSLIKKNVLFPSEKSWTQEKSETIMGGMF